MVELQAPVKEGDVLAGRYRVDRVLAAGGMGVVVAARHVQLGQRVAVKFLLPGVASSPDAAARFQREARAAAMLRSEHVAHVTDVGTLEGGQPYMVMEFLEGEDLSRVLLREGKIPIPVAVEYVLQACEALAEAHSATIVHRDLKPGNLFLTRRPDGSGLVKILDFGISKAEDASISGAAMTATTAVLGSPLYMSPEQLQSSKSVDARSDIWSLGVLLQELVTGRPSFEADQLAGLCIAIATRPPTPLTTFLPSAPPQLEAIVAKCLEKAPEARFQSVGEFAMALAPLAPDAYPHAQRAWRQQFGDAPPPGNNLSASGRAIEERRGYLAEPLTSTNTALAGSSPNVAPPRSSASWLVGGAVAFAVVVALAAVGFVGLRSRGEPRPVAASAVASDTTSPVPPPSVAVAPAATLPPLEVPKIAMSALPAASHVAATAQTAPARGQTKSQAATPTATAKAQATTDTGNSGFSDDRK